ncbi:hypothetical protein SSP24_72260 [Streptomyces spinoverrucosus]|uniref:Pvc16 N-terminal domain-containing protein n=1 Tax=Streptomyces spinoverrucosus TaxID=284043 RepID=A0A4Y3VUZ2_9ACTN|nr:DUF4255 domain-containing protein [Streptomyces spinoverrucosus]GEC09571.1 hypothetical protein SSP24_72260 [Streptomyces spinoverrucosus]GHB96014.1 hypothetical protein GCM10010397_80860 [Streptomyces spinoverrucosus]
MLLDANACLRALLAPALPAGAGLRFEPPGRDGPGGEGLGAFVFHVEEDPRARSVEWTDLRDGDGRVVARRGPVTRYRLHYLLWAHGPDSEREQALLGTAMAVLAGTPALPHQLLPGPLAQDGAGPVQIALAPPELSCSRLLEVWGALQVPAAPCLGLVLTAGLVPPADTAVPAPARRIDVDMRPRPAPGRTPTARKRPAVPKQRDRRHEP